MPNAFDPGREIIPTPGFGRKIEDLQRAGRYRTAIEEILEVLDKQPDNQEALFLAANILSVSRTQQLTCAEPLSEKYTFDQRFDPLWAVCNKCDRSWVPSPVHLGSIFGGAQMTIMNPIGQQCSKCGYTLCHECLNQITIGLGMSVYSHDCPYCEGEKLTFPVHPTGRKHLQIDRRPKLVTNVYLFREGPIPPDPAYIQAFLETRSPDVFESRPKIFGIAVGKWPESVDFYVIPYLLESGFSENAVLNSDSGTVTDESGVRVHLVKIYAN
jgi:hypothetical protein